MLLPSTFKHKAYSLIRFCFHCEMITDLPMSRRFRCRDFFASKPLQGQLPIRCAIGRMRERVAFSPVLLHGRKETAEPGTLTLRPAAPGAATLPPRDLWPPRPATCGLLPHEPWPTCPATCGPPAPGAAAPPPRELWPPHPVSSSGRAPTSFPAGGRGPEPEPCSRRSVGVLDLLRSGPVP